MRERGALKAPWEGVFCLCLTLYVSTSQPLAFPRFSCCSGFTCSEFEILFRKAQEKMLRVSDSSGKVREGGYSPPDSSHTLRIPLVLLQVNHPAKPVFIIFLSHHIAPAPFSALPFPSSGSTQGWAYYVYESLKCI